LDICLLYSILEKCIKTTRSIDLQINEIKIHQIQK